MFSGIIEKTARVVNVRTDGTNKTFTIESDITPELKIDQSVAHDGVCLTVIAIDTDRAQYQVTAIAETLDKTTLKYWKPNTRVNLERCIRLGDRIDGHMVQGHVDTVALCVGKSFLYGSWKYEFTYSEGNFITVSKGSICVNGISLTVVDSAQGNFSVAVIPYTYAHTNLQCIGKDDYVNLEFDILGKYFQVYIKQYLEQKK